MKWELIESKLILTSNVENKKTIIQDEITKEYQNYETWLFDVQHLKCEEMSWKRHYKSYRFQWEKNMKISHPDY